jgi:hypothetical protein
VPENTAEGGEVDKVRSRLKKRDLWMVPDQPLGFLGSMKKQLVMRRSMP